jgi:hypothetical protein
MNTTRPLADQRVDGIYYNQEYSRELFKEKNMITCPWCGTSYTEFQSNCKNCGGTLQPVQETTSPAVSTGSIPVPPPAPREISTQYVWRLMMTDGWSIAALVFTLLGVIFGLVGAGLTLGVVTAFVGIPFLALGFAWLMLGVSLAVWRYNRMLKVVEVLRDGVSATGRIIEVQENYSVRVNHRHPWVIRYQFQINGQTYSGEVSTLNLAGRDFQTGYDVRVLYLPVEPEWNCIYPHP